MNLASSTIRQPPSWEPKTAIVVYGSSDSLRYGRSDVVFMRHDIDVRRSGASELGAGHVLSAAQMTGLLQLASEGMRRDGISLLPETVLSTGPDHLVWYRPGARRKMWFHIGGRRVALTVPWPSLIYAVTAGRNLHVTAYRGSGRPRPDTPLWHAPLMNVGRGGDVCVGNAATPSDADPAALDGWVQVIEGSCFSHTNQNMTLRPLWRAGNQEGDDEITDAEHLRFWRNLHEQRVADFPNRYLVAMGRTLAQFLRHIA